MQGLQKATSASKLSRGCVPDAQSREANSADEWEYTDGEPTILSEEDEGVHTSNREVAEEEKETACDR